MKLFQEDHRRRRCCDTPVAPIPNPTQHDPTQITTHTQPNPTRSHPNHNPTQPNPTQPNPTRSHPNQSDPAQTTVHQRDTTRSYCKLMTVRRGVVLRDYNISATEMPCQRGKEGVLTASYLVYVFVLTSAPPGRLQEQGCLAKKETRGWGTYTITYLFVFVLAHAKEGLVVLDILVRIFLVVRPALLQNNTRCISTNNG